MRPLPSPLASLLAALLAAFSLSCAAAPFAVTVGDSRIALDAPAGFADTGFTGSPRLQELAESMTSASNRILLFALTDGDLRRFMSGDTPDFKRYAIVATSRDGEASRTRPEAFATFVDSQFRALGVLPTAGTDLKKVLDANATHVMPLAELRRESESASLLQGIRLPQPEKPGFFRDPPPPEYVLSTTSLLLVRGKVLSVLVYGPYDTPADVDWIRGTTLRWLDELQKLNTR